MSEIGRLVEVEVQPRGSALVANAAVSATSLSVVTAADFDPAGGMLDLNGARLAYIGIVYGDLPDDPDVITLDDPLANAATTDDHVWLVEGGLVAVDYVGHVLFDGAEALPSVPLYLRPLLPVGDYSSNPVTVAVSDDLTTIENAPDLRPTVATGKTGQRVELQVADDSGLGGGSRIAFFSGTTWETEDAPGWIGGSGTEDGVMTLSIHPAPIFNKPDGSPVTGPNLIPFLDLRNYYSGPTLDEIISQISLAADYIGIEVSQRLNLHGAGVISIENLEIPYAEFGTPRRDSANDTSIQPSTDTLIRWTTDDVADSTGVITNPNTALNAGGGIVVTEAGLYHVEVLITHGNNGTGTNPYRRCELVLNGSTTLARDTVQPVGTPNQGLPNKISVIKRLAANDVLTTVLNANTTAAQNLFSSSNGFAHFQIARIAA